MTLAIVEFETKLSVITAPVEIMANTGGDDGTLHKLPSEKYPPVVFDVTLYDLLKDETREGEEVETLCQFKPNSDPQHGDVVPFSEKYIIHCGQVNKTVQLAHLQLETCSHLLMFFAGPMNVIFLAAEGKVNDPNLTRKYVDYRARYSFGAITESQRQNITTHANMEDMVKNHDGSVIRWAFAMDFAERLPCLFHPDLIYKLNSKRWLAECPLRSANDCIIDHEIQCPDHTIDKQWYYGGPDCTKCIEGIKNEVERVKKLFSDTPAPYVVKMSQSLSAVGTMIVENEDEKKGLLETMDDYLREYLPRITKENAHLLTTSLILSEFIKGETTAINFFIRRDGSPIFLGACHQLATGQTGRQSTAIDYREQEKLQQKYSTVLKNIGKALHDEGGYYGPGGADIMEDPNNGTLYTIDLNVRMALSLVLYGLRTHFWHNHGLPVAMAIECMMLKVSREQLENQFDKEFSEARIVILGSTRMGEREEWAFGVIVAGEDKKAIDDLTGRLEKLETDSQADA